MNLTYVTPFLSNLMNLNAADLDNSGLSRMAANILNDYSGRNFEKCLIFNPDAVGKFLIDRYPGRFTKLKEFKLTEIGVQSMFPPKTPVCFASMYTGLEPELHGIKVYEKPVLKVETLFDRLGRSGKKTAIVAVKDSSIDLIFRDRRIDYFSEPDDRNAVGRALSLLDADKHDFIVVYNQEYDDALHRTQPESKAALQALDRQLSNFTDLIARFDSSWSKYQRIIAFAPDHGAHIDESSGRGDHGLDIPVDMELVHFWGFYDKC